MKNLILVSLALVGGLLVAGCGSTNDGLGSSTASCATPAGAGHYCYTYSGPSGAGECAGKSTVSSCPAGIGVCTVSESADGITESVATTYYSDTGTSASAAQTACTDEGGKWTN